MFSRYLVAAFLCCSPSITHAEEQVERPGPWQLGVGVIVLDKPYTGMDTEFKPIPVVGYIGERLQVFGPRASYLLAGNETFSLRADSIIRFSGYEPADSAALQGMDERDMTLEAGLTVSAGGAFGELALSVLTDVLDRHSGQEAVLRYGYEFAGERLTFTPFAGLRWISSNLADYYYGVRAEEATPSRAAYAAPSSTTPLVGLTARYRLSSHWGVFGLLTYEQLDGGLRDSPIVENDHSSLLLLTLTRNF